MELTASVYDGAATTTHPVRIQVMSNERPAISRIPDQRDGSEPAHGLAPAHCGDKETLSDKLVVSAQSSNPVLVPKENVMLYEEDGAHRHVLVIPARNQSGRRSSR